MPAEVVIHVVVVPVVLPQLGVLGVLGGRVPVVLRELLKFIILLVDLVVGLALLGWFIFLRGGAWVGIGAASTSRRASVRALFSFRAAFVPPVSLRPSWPRPSWACRSWWSLFGGLFLQPVLTRDSLLGRRRTAK